MNAVQLDEKLILQMAKGDENAFQELYRQTSSAVFGFALSILRNGHDAEDVMHDAYIRCYMGAASYVPKGKPMAWLMTIVRNLAYNRLKSGRISENIDDYEHLGSVDTTDMTVDRIVLEKAMEILEFQDRQIVILHALTGMKHREIGELLDLPTSTVLSKYRRSLAKMRKELEERGEQR